MTQEEEERRRRCEVSMLEEGDEEEEEEAPRWLLSLSEIAHGTEESSPLLSSSPKAEGEDVEKRETPATTSGGSFLPSSSPPPPPPPLLAEAEAEAERPLAGPSCIAESVTAGGHEKPRALGQALRSRHATQREEEDER